MKKYSYLFMMAIALLGFEGCGSSSSTSSVTEDSTTSATVPDDVVLSSPTESTSASASISSKGIFKAIGDPDTDDFLGKQQALQDLIAAGGDCAFTLSIPTVSSPACYGPEIEHSNHPDGPDPDNLPTGDVGIWNETEGSDNTACAAAKMNEVVGKVSAVVDNMISVFAAMACAGKKASLTLPGIGSSIDLSSAMSTHVVVSGLTISSATLERLANDSDGNKVFQSVIAMSMAFGGAHGTRTGTVTLKHIPTALDNSTYKGKVSMKMAKSAAEGVNCGGITGVEAGAVDAATILYEKASASSMKYEMNFAQFCGESTDPFDSSNNILPSDKATNANIDGWGDDWNYGSFSLNPADGTGDFAYAWQAGNGDDNTRVLNVSTSNDGSDNLSGTAHFGFGPEIATDAGRGSITKMICNWAGPGNNHDGLEIAQKQVMSKASSASVWTSTSVNMTYAPSNSCDVVALQGFIFEATDAAVMDNDQTVPSTAVIHDLVDLSTITFTVPTPPDDI